MNDERFSRVGGWASGMPVTFASVNCKMRIPRNLATLFGATWIGDYSTRSSMQEVSSQLQVCCEDVVNM